ncbi:DUF4268 domain-containing protein [Candidatus Poribacteria bacterium]|nr:DUF4268 domain-containing protein [Candidatus Poribacteria bacterium]
MRLRFCESEINHWAHRYTECQREENRMRERMKGIRLFRPQFRKVKIRFAVEIQSETDKWHLRFWTGLREYMQDKASRLNCPAPGPWRYIVFSIGRAGFSIETHLAPTRNEISIRLCIDYDNVEAYFYLLQKQQEAIEKAFGETLEWSELPGNKRSRISLTKVDTDPLDENDWPQQYEWFTAKLEVFDTVFRERIRGLDADDWVAVDDAP